MAEKTISIKVLAEQLADQRQLGLDELPTDEFSTKEKKSCQAWLPPANRSHRNFLLYRRDRWVYHLIWGDLIGHIQLGHIQCCVKFGLTGSMAGFYCRKRDIEPARQSLTRHSG